MQRCSNHADTLQCGGVQSVERLLAPSQTEAPRTGLRPSMRLNLLTAKLAFSGQGNQAHAEQTYMKYLVNTATALNDDPETREALRGVQQTLAEYDDAD
jgi:hypothetical protein